jgi:hypothetical protein
MEVPFLRPDGTVCVTPGYDPATQLVYRPAAGLAIPPIPETPTTEDLSAACGRIAEMLAEFPYADDASYANAIALLMSPAARPAVAGPTPLAFIDKPAPGTGATLLADAIAYVFTGRTAPLTGAPAKEEEWEKLITSALLAGTTFIAFDNIHRPLASAALSRALTATTWRNRVLGGHDFPILAQRATWLATGNNLRTRGDIARRGFWIRLDTKMARPWTRDPAAFAHPGLLPWLREARGELIAAVLTLLRAYFAAGCPTPTSLPVLGSFEAWVQLIGGTLAVARIPGFLGNLDALYERLDEETAEAEAFIRALAAAFPQGRVFTGAQILEQLRTVDGAALRAALPPDLAEALDSEKKGGFTRRLGWWLRDQEDRRYEGGIRLVRRGKDRTSAIEWRVVLG